MEKVIEIIEGDDDMVLIVRPMFPFAAESFRITPQGIAILGASSSIALKLDESQREMLGTPDRILLSEYPVEGNEARRELILFAH
ncbi:hypothetical protein ACEUZ9_002752 [Paracoccus litorisediminis]|uniref:hypothetical protein n=1 Tax=Paracoccus litorisediminis TaxID=2006130 RepID=UPI003733EEAF